VASEPAGGTAVDIIIVTHNSQAELSACLQALTASTGLGLMTITVVDNCSSDGTPQVVARDWPAVALIQPGSNLGFASGNNLGIRASTSELVLLLNPDTVVAADAISRLVGELADHTEAAAAGPRLIDERGVAELSFGWTISLFGELQQKVIGALYRRGAPLVRARVNRWLRTPGEREWISGACMLARRADLEAVGLFDERYFMYTEDVDLCVSLRRLGRTIRFVPEAHVVHHRGRSAKRNPHTESMRRRSQLAYYRKHHPRWAPLLTLYLRLTGKHPSAEAPDRVLGV
jgi:N-acetylglucosaminyl-diphospho-decaprenol L-rhamnosyltransferase